MRKALVVGINDYSSCPLGGCINDAVQVTDLLARNGNGSKNFDVKLKTDVQSKLELMDDIRNVELDDITRIRINDRILEMCKPIHVGGESKRTASGKQKMTTLKEVFSKGGCENE